MVCFTNRPSAATILPLTLTPSPLAGRGGVPCAMVERGKYGAAYPFSPSERGEGGGSRMRGSTGCGGLI
ncbi:hypothetical protein FHX03_001582 [Rhizobium sp. BK456]|nr:hypothetical protein [Rhizobium sp. BK456]